MNWQPCANLPVIRERARIYRQIRSFFNTRGCLEVDTPLLMPTTTTDAQIASIGIPDGDQKRFLQTSPEFAMKRLLAAGSGSIFQLGHAFRQGEAGRLHHPEFSLLEWYRVGYDYQQLMDEIELLITTLSLRQCSFTRISYRNLFREKLDLVFEEISLEELRGQCASRVPDMNSSSLDYDQCLDLLLGTVIAPAMRGYQFVYDYPISQAALARIRKDDGNVAERFELFFDGIELANGFSELTDAAEQRSRFERDNALRLERGLPQHPIDERLLAALESGMEDCAGVALGLDRLLMVLLELDSIDQVLTFTD
ncbi:MAG: EF-P lysine aminoacylase EpmA [Gammaproteobacteria bacterium]|nr:EF-P lysine aminoacylase EpmA [Gammaproteobacteria bacterium]MDH3859590.1 EF-P lysine aminoacylase EpmA [Gammaproteobacteria bacterium]